MKNQHLLSFTLIVLFSSCAGVNTLTNIKIGQGRKSFFTEVNVNSRNHNLYIRTEKMNYVTAWVLNKSDTIVETTYEEYAAYPETPKVGPYRPIIKKNITLIPGERIAVYKGPLKFFGVSFRKALVADVELKIYLLFNEPLNSPILTEIRGTYGGP